MANRQTAHGGRTLPELVSNGTPLEMTPERLGWLQPSDPGQTLGELRDRYARQGYLWLRGLLDREEVLAFRRHYFAATAETGLVAPDRDPVLGVMADSPADRARLGARHLAIVHAEAFESLCRTPRMVAFYERFLGGPVHLHGRKLLRHMEPGAPHCTGAHYDLVYLRGGTDRLCTSWIPLGDTPVEMGGLCYLEGSDAWGRQKEAEHRTRTAHLDPAERVNAYNAHMAGGWLSRDLRALAHDAGLRWLVADYAAGDMVVHSPYMIHASTMNTDGERRIRLSADIRYQLAADPIDQRWQNLWRPDDGL